MRSLLALREGDYRGAQEAATVAERLAVNEDPRCARMIALASLHLEDWQGATDYANKALDRGGLDTVNLLIIAVAAEKLENHAQATKDLKGALKAWPNSLIRDGQKPCSAPKTVLWYESNDDLCRLLQMAKEVVGPIEHGRIQCRVE
jgi:tetratricopeptide (TPR) repeat protein